MGKEMLSWFSIACASNDAPLGKLSANTCVILLYFFIPKKDENCQKHTYVAALIKNTDLLYLLNSCKHSGLITTPFPVECATVAMWRTVDMSKLCGDFTTRPGYCLPTELCDKLFSIPRAVVLSFLWKEKNQYLMSEKNRIRSLFLY